MERHRLEVPKDNPDAFDFTAIDCYQVCQRRYYFRHILGLVGQARQMAPEFGHAIHCGLGEWHRAHSMDSTLNTFTSDWETLGGDDPNDSKRTTEIGKKILRGYATKYATEPFTIVRQETPFSVSIEGRSYIGRMDEVIEWDGAVMPMEHKTSSSLGYSTFNTYNPNLQILGYTYACKSAIDESCYKALVDVLLVAKTKQDWARQVITKTEQQIEEFPRLFLDLTDEILESYNTGRFLPNYGQCTYYGECPYRRLCMQTPELWERIMETEYRTNHWHPHAEASEGAVLKVEAKL